MKFFTVFPALIAALSATACATVDPAAACYNTPLPALKPATSPARSIPWGSPVYQLPNGSTCCSSIAEVRAGINVINDQIIDLLAQRAAYVREATRFKGTVDSVDVPARNKEVIEGAVAKAKAMNASGSGLKLPENIVRGVFEAIIAQNVPFEKCVFQSY
ncbi:hypothetical protein NHQ30_007597 [Ciborinia camelliae]|nr:hypothetical protein NHQ30_007597 [Ciborinia camelliae]